MFRIRLHIDNIGYDLKCHTFVCVGRVVDDGNSCLFIIS